MKERKNLFNKKLKVINLGIKAFAEDLEKQGIKVVNMDWQPPAGGDVEILKLLDKLEDGIDSQKKG